MFIYCTSQLHTLVLIPVIDFKAKELETFYQRLFLEIGMIFSEGVMI